MNQTAEVTQLVFDAIREVNQQLPPQSQMAAAVDTPLVGAESPLDSLGLVNLIVAIEQHAEAKWNTSLMLFDAMATGVAESPFNTVGTLVNYISQRIAKSANA
ncbi:MAG: hypothetical protein ABI977_12300 [Acidobacteriota bacterium]